MGRLIMYIMLIVAMVASGCGSPKEQAGAKQIIIDSVGRKIELQGPLNRVAVANAYNAELINALNAIDKVVGVDYNIYQDQGGFKDRFTKEQIIGKNQRELNYEKIVAINPEAVILTGNGHYKEAEEKLAPFGIKVIVVDSYYTEFFKENCHLMGKLLGKEQEAAELANYFDDKLALIANRIKDVEKKRVYFEYRRIGNTTIPGNYFYKMVEFGGGDNVFKDAKNVNVDPEAIIKANPDYIIKVSNINVYSSYEPPTLEDHLAIKEELCNRPGWSTINAVKNDKIMLMSHYVHGGASKNVGALYIAKFLYPEQLQDLHPEAVFKEWLEKYQHLPYIAGHTYPAYSLEE